MFPFFFSYLNPCHTYRIPRKYENKADALREENDIVKMYEKYASDPIYIPIMIELASRSLEDAILALHFGLPDTYLVLGILYRDDFSLYKKIRKEQGGFKIDNDLISVLEDVYLLYEWALTEDEEYFRNEEDDMVKIMSDTSIGLTHDLCEYVFLRGSKNFIPAYILLRNDPQFVVANKHLLTKNIKEELLEEMHIDMIPDEIIDETRKLLLE